MTGTKSRREHTVRALVLNSPRNLRVEDIPLPSPGPGEALVEILFCGICGSDISGFKGTSPVMCYPMSGMGHEGVGIVLEAPPNDRGIAPGDRVCLEPYLACGVCHTCGLGRYNNCERLRTCGVHRDGIMAGTVAHPVASLFRVPADLPDAAAVMTEPLSNAVHANRRAGIRAGETCLVIGAGPIGMLTALVAAAYGATPVVADVLDSRLDFCRGLGLPHVCNNDRENLEERLRGVFGGDFPDVVFECSGSAAMAEKSVDWVRTGGRVVFVGLACEDSRFNTTALIRKELDLFASRNSRDCFPEAMELLRSGRVLLTGVVTMNEAPALFETLVAQPEKHVKTAVHIGC